jgi:MarR family transcriptional regulator, transcriptional regulator for hemolysin
MKHRQASRLFPGFECPMMPNEIQLYDVARHMRTYVDQRAHALGLTRAQMIILARLERQPEISQSELAAIAEVAPITIVRLIDRLEEMGLVRRCPDASDRRAWRLRLTEAAAPLLREIKRARARLHHEMTGGIKPAVLEAMAAGLRQMKENLGERRPAKPSVRKVHAEGEVI